MTAAGRFGSRKGASGTKAGALLVVLGFMGWDPMIEICEFWNALWHDAWATWDGLWLFQAGKRPIDRALNEARYFEALGLG